MKLTRILSSADLFESLREMIEARLQDKEPSVRAQAILAIRKLTGSGDDDDDGSNEYLQQLSSVLEDIAVYDEAA